MKDKYIDQYGNDSLPHLRLASGKTDYFITTNQSLLDDRDELETLFLIRIRTPKEFLDEQKKNEQSK